jgi:putative cell wall-binding protein
MASASRSRAPAWRRTVPGAVLLTALAVPAAPAAADTTTRLAGDTNVEAAVAWSQATFADGAPSVVLLARDDDFADALTSGSAQAVLDAPLLLTDSAVPSPETLAELDRLDPDEVRIMGGEAAVSAAVETALEGLGYTVSRYAGSDRVDTAVMVAEDLFPNATSAVITRAFAGAADPTQAFADAIAAGAYSAGAMVPVLLTGTAELSAGTAAYVAESAIETAVITGGEAAVSAAAEAELSGAGVAVARAAGATRGGTAVALAAELGFPSADAAPRVLLVEGTGADAWAGGLTIGAQAGNGAAVVLANGPALFAETAAFLDGGTGVPLVCGPGVDEAACDAASDALGNEG